jgi:hypothetical protein
MARATHFPWTLPEQRAGATAEEPTYQAFVILHLAFVAAPVIAGIDKFAHLLTDWDKYLSPAYAQISPFSPHVTMQVVGVVEIIAGLLVALRPRIGAYVVAVWLVGIMLDLVLAGGYLDVALRDLGLFLGALALARLSARYDRVPEATQPSP